MVLEQGNGNKLQNRPLFTASSVFHDILSLNERGAPNSMPIIRPLPRTAFTAHSGAPCPQRLDETFAHRSGILDQPFLFDDVERRIPAAIAKSFFEKVEPCTTARPCG